MANVTTVQAETEGITATFQLDFDEMTWTTGADVEEAEFPFVAEIGEKRYELYSDGTFDEEEF